MYKVIIEGQEIDYYITRRNNKHLYVKFKPNKMVEVVANDRITLKQIEGFFNDNSQKVLKYLKKYNSIPVENNEYKNGDEVHYLGCKYILKVTYATRNKVVISNSEIELSTRAVENISIKEKILYQFYKEELEEVIEKLYQQNLSILRKNKIKVKPIFMYRRMKARWGSCNKVRQKVIFNTELAKFDISIINYVFMHEMAHMIHPNHSDKFYGLLTKLLPEWKAYREQLKKMHIEVK